MSYRKGKMRGEKGSKEKHEEIVDYIYNNARSFVYVDDYPEMVAKEPEFYSEYGRLRCKLDIYIRGRERDYFYEVKSSNHRRARKRGLEQLYKAQDHEHLREAVYMLVYPEKWGREKVLDINIIYHHIVAETAE